MEVIKKIGAILNNFWVALALAIVGMFGAAVCFVAGDTGFSVLNIAAAWYWLFVAWTNRSPKEAA